MKVIVINPHDQTITEAEYDGTNENLTSLMHCDMIDVVYRNDRGESLFGNHSDGVFVDDEGLLGNLAEQAFFKIKGKPLAGYGVVIGCDKEGETISPHCTVDDVRKIVEFTTLYDLRMEWEG